MCCSTLVVGEQPGFRIVPFRVSGACTSKFAGHCKCEHAQLSKTIGLSSVCSLHKSAYFGFVSWFFFNVQFFCLYIYVLPAEMGSQIRPKQAARQFAPSLTKKKATNLKRKNPTRFSLDQKKQIVDLHHKKVSNLCHFTECYCRQYAYVWVHLFAFSCYAGFLGFFAMVFFLTPRIVAVALAVRNRTSTTNSLDLLLGIKRMGDHWSFITVQSAQIDLFWFRILILLQCLVFAFTFMFYQLKWELKFVPSRQFGSSPQVWRRRKRPTWDGKTQRVFHSIRRSKLLIFTTRKWVICVV